MTDPRADPHRYVTAADCFTLEYVIGSDGIAKWTGKAIVLPALVSKAPGPVIADLIALLTDERLNDDSK